jgi:hypothetical protein
LKTHVIVNILSNILVYYLDKYGDCG